MWGTSPHPSRLTPCHPLPKGEGCCIFIVFMHSLYHTTKGGIALKKIIAVLLILVFLTGCAKEGDLNTMMELRAELKAAQGCQFDCNIIADYGNKSYSFSVECRGDQKGNVDFTVAGPDSISGISGTITDGKGNLHFDGTALAFELLADGLLSPVSGPWVFLNTLRGGVVTSCGQEGELTRVTLDDSYEADALTVDLWLDESNTPVQAEISWQGRRILTLVVTKFVIG